MKRENAFAGLDPARDLGTPERNETTYQIKQWEEHVVNDNILVACELI